jgi:hypothetical protein
MISKVLASSLFVPYTDLDPDPTFHFEMDPDPCGTIAMPSLL